METQGKEHAWVRFLPGALRARVVGRQNLQSAVANSGWLAFDRLARMLLALLVGSWVARYLGPSAYGKLAYVVALLAFFQAIATLGMDSLVVRDLSRSGVEASGILGTAFALRAVTGLLCWFLGVCCVLIFSDTGDDTVVLIALAGGALLFQAADTVDLWFQSQSQSGRTVLAKLVAFLISNGVKVLLILLQASLIAFAATMLLEAVTAAAALALAYRRMPAPGSWRVVRTVADKYLKDGAPLLLSGISIILYMRIDQIMIREMLGERSLGIYAVALPFCQIWQSLPAIICTSVAPLVSRKKADNQAEYTRFIVIVFRVCFYLGIASTIFMFLISTQLVHVLFGEEFRDAAAVIKLYSVSNIFCFLGIAHSLWMVNERIFKVRLYGTVLAGAVTIAANYFLIPNYGIMGACYSAIIAQFVAAVLINVALDRPGLRLQGQAVLGRWSRNVLS